MVYYWRLWYAIFSIFYSDCGYSETPHVRRPKMQQKAVSNEGWSHVEYVKHNIACGSQKVVSRREVVFYEGVSHNKFHSFEVIMTTFQQVNYFYKGLSTV